jgi:hypothetical protein
MNNNRVMRKGNIYYRTFRRVHEKKRKLVLRKGRKNNLKDRCEKCNVPPRSS